MGPGQGTLEKTHPWEKLEDDWNLYYQSVSDKVVWERERPGSPHSSYPVSKVMGRRGEGEMRVKGQREVCVCVCVCLEGHSPRAQIHCFSGPTAFPHYIE